MEDFGIRGCIDPDGAIFPNTRPLFRVIPERKPASLIEIVNQFLKWGDSLISFIGAKPLTSERVIIHNGQNRKDDEENAYPPVEASPSCEYESHEKGNHEY